MSADHYQRGLFGGNADGGATGWYGNNILDTREAAIVLDAEDADGSLKRVSRVQELAVAAERLVAGSNVDDCRGGIEQDERAVGLDPKAGDVAGLEVGRVGVLAVVGVHNPTRVGPAVALGWAKRHEETIIGHVIRSCSALEWRRAEVLSGEQLAALREGKAEWSHTRGVVHDRAGRQPGALIDQVRIDGAFCISPNDVKSGFVLHWCEWLLGEHGNNCLDVTWLWSLRHSYRPW